MTWRDPLDALHPAPPTSALRTRVLAAARAARRDARRSAHWFDALAENRWLLRLWRVAMLTALLGHLWVSNAGERAVRRWRLETEPTTGPASLLEARRALASGDLR